MALQACRRADVPPAAVVTDLVSPCDGGVPGTAEVLTFAEQQAVPVVPVSALLSAPATTAVRPAPSTGASW